MKLAFLFIDFLYLQSDFICNLYMMVISTLLFLFLCPFRTNGNLSLLWVLKDMPLKYYSSRPILLLKNKPDVFKTYVCKASCSFSTMVNRGQEAESLLKRIYKVEVKADVTQIRGWWTFGEMRKGTGGQMEKWLLWAESKLKVITMAP